MGFFDYYLFFFSVIGLLPTRFTAPFVDFYGSRVSFVRSLFFYFLMLTSFTCLTVFCLTLFSLVFFFFYIFSHGFLSCFPWKPLPGDASNWRPTPQNQLTDKNTRTKYSGCHEIASAPATEDSAEFGGQVAQQRGSLLKPTSVVRRILRSSLMKIGLELLQIIVIVLLPVLPPVDFGDREHHHHPTRSSFWIRNHISLCIASGTILDFLLFCTRELLNFCKGFHHNKRRRKNNVLVLHVSEEERGKPSLRLNILTIFSRPLSISLITLSLLPSNLIKQFWSCIQRCLIAPKFEKG